MRWKAPNAPTPSATGLPPRTLPAGPPLRAPVSWVQTDLRVAHLPPADWRQIGEFLKMGYQVVAVNTLSQWDRVGPRAGDYPVEIVKEADAYLRRFVSMAHEAGAKAVFYLGPVQSPPQSDVFRQKHPDWLRVNDDGTRANDCVNFRHPEIVSWLCAQFACLAGEYQADGFWFDGYSPAALHTYDPATRQAFRDFSGGKEMPARNRLNPRDPVARQYLQWHEAYFAGSGTDRLAHAHRFATEARLARPGRGRQGRQAARRGRDAAPLAHQRERRSDAARHDRLNL